MIYKIIANYLVNDRSKKQMDEIENIQAVCCDKGKTKRAVLHISDKMIIYSQLLQKSTHKNNA